MRRLTNPLTSEGRRMGPLIPRPAVTAIALMVTIGMLVHIGYDATHDLYDGYKTTLLMTGIICGILGFELFRGRR